MKRHERRRPMRGFTMIELLLVLVILGVLAVMVVPRFAGRSEQARVTAAKNDLARLVVALDSFEIDNGRYPDSSEGLAALVRRPNNVTNWTGPYLQNVQSEPKDPWGNPYRYVYPSRRNEGGYDLYSIGPDGQEGTDDDIYPGQD